MMAWFPKIYPDELVYSLLARYYAHSGYTGYLSAAEELFAKPWVNPSVDFINTLTAEAKEMLSMQKPMEDIIIHHTMYPCLVRFQKQEKRKQLMADMMEGRGNYHLTDPFIRKNSEQRRFLKYCPLCAQEDREQYGESYWHRMHQIPGIPLCPIHFCQLHDSALQISDKPHHGLLTAEELCTETEVVISEDPVSQKLAAYLKAVFLSEVSDTDIQIGQVLNHRLMGTPYVSPRGLKRDMVSLRQDFCHYYGLTEGINAPEIWMLDKLLSGKRIQFTEVCMLALFLGVSNENQINPITYPETAHTAEFDALIHDLRRQGLKYTEISKQVGLSYDYVKLIGKGKKTVKSKQNHSRKSAYHGRDWGEYDQEMLPLVKTHIQKILSAPGRPKQVSVGAVAKAMQIPVARFRKMPLCTTEIQSHQESQPEYWARESVWAVKMIFESNQKLNWKQFRLLTNMKRQDFAACFPNLPRYADAELVELLRFLLPESASEGL